MKVSGLATGSSLVIVLGLIYTVFGEAPKQVSQVQPQGQAGAEATTENFSTLYNFDGKCAAASASTHCDPAVQDGVGVKVGAVVQGPAGDDSFYGATPGGGTHNWGTIFQVTPAKGVSANNASASVTVLYSFGDSGLKDGRNPSGGLTLGNDGNLYGATYAGGDKGFGTIFKMAPSGGTPEILYSFRNGSQDPVPRGEPARPPLTPTQIDDLSASYPVSPPILASDGNLYGVTPSSNPDGGGVAYQLDSGHTLHCLHRFKGTEAAAYGLHPSTLAMTSDGSFYGTTEGDDHGRYDTVFQFDPSGGGASVTRLHTFAVGTDGGRPNGVIKGHDGSLYGVTYSGGPLYRGVVFRLTPDGKYTVLHAFGGNASNPVTILVEVLANDSATSTNSSAPQTQSYYLYGASSMNYSSATREDSGILFRLREDGDGKDFVVVHNFDGVAGVAPNVTPVLVRGDSSICGIGAGGGKFSAGVFYRMPVCVPAAPPLALDYPGSRICCAFGYAPALDPSSLGPHKYGNGDPARFIGDIPLGWMRSALPANSDTYAYIVSAQDWFATRPVASDIFPWPAKYIGERVGYVLTSNAGLVDVGHVRYTADATFWVYERLAAGQKAVSVFSDRAWVTQVPTCKEEVVKLAAAIAWTYGWSHELSTWGDGGEPREDYSAFSPEDLSSNIVGIEAASRAIEAGGDASVEEFDKQMTSALNSIMTELDARADTQTSDMVGKVEAVRGDPLQGKWWMGDTWLTTTRYTSSGWLKLLRRNFDGKAWAVVGNQPDWLSTTRFSEYNSQFLYVMTQNVDARRVPESNAYASTILSQVTPPAPGHNGMNWILTPVGSLAPAANYTAGASGQMPSVTDSHKNPIVSGQFAMVLVNSAGTGGPKLIFATMKDATAAIQRAFNAANPGSMDGP